MYGKIFESMYDGTLAADWKAMVTFQQMIVLADQDGIIDYTPPALARRTGIPLEIIEHGIKKLEEPDPYSRTPDEDGRRICRLDNHRPWGWYIVNYDRYRMMASREERRIKDRERKRLKRAQDIENTGVSADVRSCPHESAMSAHVDVDTDVDKTPTHARARGDFYGRKAPEDFKATPEMVEKIIEETGFTRDELAQYTREFMDHCFERSTFDWPGRWRNWMRRQQRTKSGNGGGSGRKSYQQRLEEDEAARGSGND